MGRRERGAARLPVVPVGGPSTCEGCETVDVLRSARRCPAQDSQFPLGAVMANGGLVWSVEVVTAPWPVSEPWPGARQEMQVCVGGATGPGVWLTCDRHTVCRAEVPSAGWLRAAAAQRPRPVAVKRRGCRAGLVRGTIPGRRVGAASAVVAAFPRAGNRPHCGLVVDRRRMDWLRPDGGGARPGHEAPPISRGRRNRGPVGGAWGWGEHGGSGDAERARPCGVRGRATSPACAWCGCGAPGGVRLPVLRGGRPVPGPSPGG